MLIRTTAMKRELGWMYTEYTTSEYGNTRIVREWWSEDAPTREEVESGRVEIVDVPAIFA